MMRKFWVCSTLSLLTFLLMLSSPGFPEPIVRVTILHLNDVYEIAPVSGGTQGGLARVATLRKQLLQQNPNTLVILAGDLLSPSALGTVPVEGEELAGKHIVAVMNAVGLNYSTFGNHEFDLKADQLYRRLQESRFTWFSSNVLNEKEQAFEGVPPYVIHQVRLGEEQIQIGLFGLTIASNPKPYVKYKPYLQAAEEHVAALAKKVDILIAVTHLSIDQDRELAQKVPQIHLILGGHEHENMHVRREPESASIYKADANARTVYIHDLLYNTNTRSLEIRSRLQRVTPEIPPDPEVRALVDEWEERAFKALASKGFRPRQPIAHIPESLDGLETSVRNHPTTLTTLMAKGILRAYSNAELAIFNGGAIRIDDTLPAGELTQYDVLRILPFGGTVVLVEMKGTLLQHVLDQGNKNQGSGGYLQTANVQRNTDGTEWVINGELLQANRFYRVAVNDFLLTGREQGLEFLTRKNDNLRILQENELDIRHALISQLQADFGAQSPTLRRPLSSSCY